jgi:hypothetical protein
MRVSETSQKLVCCCGVLLRVSGARDDFGNASVE